MEWDCDRGIEYSIQKIKKNRKCKLLNDAISEEVKEVEFMEVTEGLTQMSGINNNFFERNVNIISKNSASKTKSFKIKTITFDQVLSKNSKIDYLSIDIEGGEMALLNSINFNDYEIKVISVENNILKIFLMIKISHTLIELDKMKFFIIINFLNFNL